MELNAKLLSVVLNTKTLKMIQCYTNVYVAIRITKKYDENLKKRFANMSKFSNHDINEFILLFLKGFHPCEYMGGWEKFNEISLIKKEDF